jgi:hypothetical protein
VNRNTTGIQCKSAAQATNPNNLERLGLFGYNVSVLGAGFILYAVGVSSPSVWGGLLVTDRPARHFILFCFPLQPLYGLVFGNAIIFCYYSPTQCPHLR